MILFLLSLAFGPSADLGHPKFKHREAASLRIERGLPWSLPIALDGLRSRDAEVRDRSRRVLESGCPRLVKARGLLNPKVRELLLEESYPADDLLRAFRDRNDFKDLYDVADAIGVVNHEQELQSLQYFGIRCHEEGIALIFAARARAVRLGLKPQLHWASSPDVPWKER